MRRTVLSAMALACTAVLASAVPAFADGTIPSPAPAAPTPRVAPPASATPAPSVARTPSAVRPRVTDPKEVAAVPKGAPDTGVAPVSAQSGAEGGLIGGGAVAVFAAGTVFLVRRLRATGA
ncbi:sortase-dependent protein [Streptomyces sp. H27-C3]|uniref:sortase-dependent protein n=1 Tax=Streptomyces sp. H27-C3 TaxID=3046305 RepID=UPI0024B8B152|nr:sortase-dependent protein [Streptomyces sp. H27-C3]MDJ0466960.1 sortase-dependent protein [Streptomyces sp. H27-C3]